MTVRGRGRWKGFREGPHELLSTYASVYSKGWVGGGRSTGLGRSKWTRTPVVEPQSPRHVARKTAPHVRVRPFCSGTKGRSPLGRCRLGHLGRRSSVVPLSPTGPRAPAGLWVWKTVVAVESGDPGSEGSRSWGTPTSPVVGRTSRPPPCRSRPSVPRDKRPCGWGFLVFKTLYPQRS